MKLTSSSTARRSTASALFRSFGGPHTPSPVRRIAPKPRRFTDSSPPRDTCPANFAEISLVILVSIISRSILRSSLELPCPCFLPNRLSSPSVTLFYWNPVRAGSLNLLRDRRGIWPKIFLKYSAATSDHKGHYSGRAVFDRIRHEK